MGSPSSSSATPGTRSEIAKDPAPWAFAKGVLVGGIVEIPALSGATYLLAKLAASQVLAMEIVRTTTLFAGIPALVTAGGLGRLAAHECARSNRRSAILHTCAVHALAGVMLVLIASIAQDLWPPSAWAWIALVGAGAAAGAGAGAAVGVVCAGATPRQVTDVLSLVKLPAATLRQLIESEDLGRLGAAVRHRASLVFDGLLEPAAPRPEEAEAGAASMAPNRREVRATREDLEETLASPEEPQAAAATEPDRSRVRPESSTPPATAGAHDEPVPPAST